MHLCAEIYNLLSALLVGYRCFLYITLSFKTIFMDSSYRSYVAFSFLFFFFLQDIAIRNLDYIFTVSGHAVANTSLDVSVMLEKVWHMKSSEPWSYHRLPTPTAPFPAIIDSEENDKIELLRIRGNCTSRPMLRQERDQRLDNFLQPDEMKEGVLKQVRALRKKLQQIEMLEEKRFKGQILDDQQIAKLQTKSALEKSLAELGVPALQSTVSSSVLADGKGSSKVDVPKKQSRKSKQKAAPVEVASSQCESAEPCPRKGASSEQIEVMFYPFVFVQSLGDWKTVNYVPCPVEPI